MTTPKTLCSIATADFRDFLGSLGNSSVDLILTDPPYTISRKTGFQQLGAKSVERFAVSMDFGEWDHGVIDLHALCKEGYRVLYNGGTMIVIYDQRKITLLVQAMTNAGFK